MNKDKEKVKEKIVVRENDNQVKRRKKNKKGKKYDDERLVKAPIAQSISFTTRRPKIVNDGRRYCVHHRELIAEIPGSVGFTIQQNLIINPGFSSTFPWLSPIANQWEQYRFKSLSFHYIGRCPTTFSGSVMLVPEYDVLDADPASKIQASTYVGAVEQSPWTNFSCKLDPSALQPIGPKKYVRSGPVLGDLKTYDGGKFLVITQGQVDTSICGDLWVEYDAELFVPQSGTAQSGSITSSTVSMFYFFNPTTISSGSAVDYSLVRQNPLGIVNSSGVYTPLAGTYRIDASLTHGSAAYSIGINFYVNGTGLAFGSASDASSFSGRLAFSDILTFNGTDTFEVRVSLGGAAVSFTDSSLIFTLV